MNMHFDYYLHLLTKQTLYTRRLHNLLHVNNLIIIITIIINELSLLSLINL